MEVVFSGNKDLYVNSCIVWRYLLVVLWAGMLCRVLYGGSVWWYHRFVCYVVYCMEVPFDGIIGRYVMSCIVWKFCLVVS